MFACWIQCQEEKRYDCRYQSPKWKTVEWHKDCHSCPPPHESLHGKCPVEWRNCGEASQNTQTKMFGWWRLFLWRLSVRRSRRSGKEQTFTLPWFRRFLKTWEPREPNVCTTFAKFTVCIYIYTHNNLINMYIYIDIQSHHLLLVLPLNGFDVEWRPREMPVSFSLIWGWAQPSASTRRFTS